jgi:hypothetical protein
MEQTIQTCIPLLLQYQLLNGDFEFIAKGKSDQIYFEAPL